jgi:hypothetical protein
LGRSWFLQAAPPQNCLNTCPQHHVEVSAHRWGISTVLLEIAFTDKEMMILFSPHCQGLGVSILLSHQQPY